MLKEFYTSLPSFSEERFVTDDPLSETIIQTVRDPICLNIPNMFCSDPPAECKQCSQIYCSVCLELLAKNHGKCPNCREKLQVSKLNTFLKTILLKLSMHCHFQENGCTQTFPIEELSAHEANCEYDAISCPNGCNKTVIKKFVKEHTEFECPQEIVKCSHQFCLMRLPKAQMFEHEATCEYRVNSDVKANENVIEEEEKSFQSCRDSFTSRLSNLSPTVNLQKLENQYLSENIETTPPKKINLVFDSWKEKQPREPQKFQYLRLTRCKNPGCYYSAAEDKLAAHEEICSYKVFNCKYASQGCEYANNKLELIPHEAKCEFAPASQKNGGRSPYYYGGARDYKYVPNSYKYNGGGAGYQRQGSELRENGTEERKFSDLSSNYANPSRRVDYDAKSYLSGGRSYQAGMARIPQARGEINKENDRNLNG